MTNNSRKLADRNAEIFYAVEAGNRVQKIADCFGISYERVRQIHAKEKRRVMKYRAELNFILADARAVVAAFEALDHGRPS